jgi:hypothetical protein
MAVPGSEPFNLNVDEGTRESGMGGTPSPSRTDPGIPEGVLASESPGVPEVVVGEVSATTAETVGADKVASATAANGVLKLDERKPRYVLIRGVITHGGEPC